MSSLWKIWLRINICIDIVKCVDHKVIKTYELRQFFSSSNRREDSFVLIRRLGMRQIVNKTLL